MFLSLFLFRLVPTSDDLGRPQEQGGGEAVPDELPEHPAGQDERQEADEVPEKNQETGQLASDEELEITIGEEALEESKAEPEFHEAESPQSPEDVLDDPNEGSEQASHDDEENPVEQSPSQRRRRRKNCGVQ